MSDADFRRFESSIFQFLEDPIAAVTALRRYGDVAAVAAGIGLIAARDNKVSSEDVGIK